jgi:excinuclease UvrABC ATPase subunit
MVPDPSLTIRERAVAAWPMAWGGQNLRDILISLGIDVDKPWRSLPKKVRNWILFTDEQPQVPVYPGWNHDEIQRAIRRKTEPAYMGTFSSAKRHVTHSFATTQSAMMKKRAARFMIASPCPVCDGKRLRRESLSVTLRGPRLRRDEPFAHGPFLKDLRALCRGEQPASSLRCAKAILKRRWSSSASQPTFAAGCRSCSISAWAISRWNAARRRCLRASCSACGLPPRSSPTCSASSM